MRQFSEDTDYDSGSSTGAFFTGLFAGAVIGAGLGLWFAPKTGQEMRDTITGTARDVGQRVGKTMNDLADRGREALDRGREALDRAREVVTNAGEQVSQAASQAMNQQGTGQRPPRPQTMSGAQTDARSS